MNFPVRYYYNSRKAFQKDMSVWNTLPGLYKKGGYMKRKVLFTLFLLLPMLAVMATENSWRYAKEPVLILKKDSAIKDISSNEKMFSKDDRFLFGRKVSNGSEMGFGVDLWDPLTIEIYFRDSNGIAYSSNINDVYLEDNNLKIDTDIKNSHWIPSSCWNMSHIGIILKILQRILILPGLIVLRYKDFILMIFILYILVSMVIMTMLIF